jgi:hypothetical protein
MRKLVLALGLVIVWPSGSQAAPCVIGTLADYLSPGFTGCQLGPATISPFLTTAATPGDITVTPDAGALAFDFGLDLTAPPFTTVAFQYSLSGVSLNRADLSFTGASATGDGVVSAIEFLCFGGTFFPLAAPFGCDPLNVDSLAVVQLESVGTSPDTLEFAPNSFFDVFVEITVDPGLFGTASLDGTVRTAFAGVPEPSALLLVGSGLAAWLGRRKRRP